MPRKIQLPEAQKRKISNESSEINATSVMENIKVNNDASEEPPAFASTSAEIENNISKQVSEGEESPHPHSTNTSVDMESEALPCDSNPVMWFPVREKHVSFWSTAIICQNKNDSYSYPESRRYYQSGQGKLD